MHAEDDDIIAKLLEGLAGTPQIEGVFILDNYNRVTLSKGIKREKNGVIKSKKQ